MLKTSKNHAHGHRQRARAKFIESQEHRIKQEDYEILELLLNYTIPRKDTKPIAKNLLTCFKTFDAIFNTSHDELSHIPDIGLSSLTFFDIQHEFIQRAIQINPKPDIRNLPTNTLEHYAHFAHKHATSSIEAYWIICLGNNAVFISCTQIDLVDNKNPFEDMRPFIKVALNANAKSVIIFSNRKNASLHVSYEEIEASQKAKNLFNSLGVKLHERIIISANKAILIFLQRHLDIKKTEEIPHISEDIYVSFTKQDITSLILSHSPDFANLKDIEILAYLLHKADFKDDIEKILYLFTQNSIDIKNMLTLKLNTIENIFTKALKEKSFEKLVFFLSLQRELILRYLSVNYLVKTLSKRKTLENINDIAHLAYFHLAHCQKEEIWLVHIDNNKKLLDFEMVSVQALASASVDIGYIVTRVLHYKSHSVIVLHNHPSGSIEPSTEDLASTKELADILKKLGTNLLEHMIIADRSCTLILAKKVLYF